jgi:hypothetical protein
VPRFLAGAEICVGVVNGLVVIAGHIWGQLANTRRYVGTGVDFTLFVGKEDWDIIYET